MQELVECIPNFNEGKDQETIDLICAAIETANGHVLHTDIGVEVDRTVVTFVARQEDMVAAALAGIKVGCNRIDMRGKASEHPRIGAVDVVPIVPLGDTSMQSCIAIANQLAKETANELRLPVYLYAEAAKQPNRRHIADIRRIGYEQMQHHINKPEWHPDYGPTHWDPKVGGCIVGARNILIAFNVSLDSTDVKLAKRIAKAIRERSHLQKNSAGTIKTDENGYPKYRAGRFMGVQAKGWYLPKAGIAQVSMNITDAKQAPLFEIYKAIQQHADANGVKTLGCELVGLIPEEALAQAGRSFMERDQQEPTKSSRDLISLAAQELNLSHFKPFDIDNHVLEYACQRRAMK